MNATNDDLLAAIRSMNGKAVNGTATWGVLASWASVILALVFGIGGAIGMAFGLALSDTRLAVKGLQERELVNAEDRGRQSERIDRHGDGLLRLDEVLQREMRQLDQAMIVQIEGLDARLQGEIARSARDAELDREVLRDAIAEMREYQNHAREVNATQDERERAIERQLYEPK